MAETGGRPPDGQVEEARVRAAVQHLRYQHQELQVRDGQHLQGECSGGVVCRLQSRLCHAPSAAGKYCTKIVLPPAESSRGWLGLDANSITKYASY